MSADLFYRKRIHISTQADGTIATARPQNTDNAGAFMHFNAERAQAMGDPGLCTDFVKTDLWIPVQAPAQLGQFVLKGSHLSLCLLLV